MIEKSIKEKFENEIYSIETIPRIMSIDNSVVFVNKYAPRPNEIDSLEKFDIEDDLVKTEKFFTDSWGDWELTIGMISASHFESREKFDEMVKKESYVKNFDSISIQKALEYIYVTLTPNMDYYINNWNELENELKRTVYHSELKDEHLKNELFYRQMCNLFGESDDDITTIQDGIPEREFILKDFRYVSFPNFIYATAQRGNFYLKFAYVTS